MKGGPGSGGLTVNQALTLSQERLKAGDFATAATIMGAVFSRYRDDPGIFACTVQTFRAGGYVRELIPAVTDWIARHDHAPEWCYTLGRLYFLVGENRLGHEQVTRGLPYYLAKKTRGGVPAREPRPSVLCAALPKSASTNLVRSLADLLDLTAIDVGFGELYPDIGVEITDAYLDTFARGGFISHSHLAPTEANVEAVLRRGIGRILIHRRDPRQTLISFKSYIETTPELTGRLNVVDRGYFDRSDSARIDTLLAGYFEAQVRWIDGWRRIAHTHAGRLDVLFTSFEGLVAGEATQFRAILDFLGHGELPLPRLRSEHRRKGALDEWRGVCTPAQAAAMDRIMAAYGLPTDGVFDLARQAGGRGPRPAWQSPTGTGAPLKG